MFATVHVVGSNNDLEPWLGIDSTDNCTSPRPERIAEFDAPPGGGAGVAGRGLCRRCRCEGRVPAVHWVKVHVDPRSSGVFSVEQKIVRSNL